MAILIPILGSAIGGTIFGNAAAGWIIGSALGNILFPKGGGQEGPRIDDLTVTSSAYGVTIPKSFGTVKVAGNIIWALPVREAIKEEKKGGIFGIGGTTVTSYSYSATFALALGEGVADRVIRIWANEKLIYDNGSPVLESVVDLSQPFAVLAEFAKQESGVQGSSIDFEFYSGTEDQPIDPIILADKGSEAIPYRGITYIVFDDIPLADYGNVLPQIKVELAYVNPTILDNTITITPQNGTPSIEPVAEGTAVDWIRRKAYGSLNNDIMSIDLNTMNEVSHGTISSSGLWTGLRHETLTIGRTNGLIYIDTTGQNSGPIISINPTTMQQVGIFGRQSIDLSYKGWTVDTPPDNEPNAVRGDAMVTVVVKGSSGDREFLFHMSLIGAGWLLLNISTSLNSDSYIAHRAIGSVTRATRGEERLGSSDLYFTSTTTISKIVIDYDASTNKLTGLTRGVDDDLTPRLVFVDRTIRNLFYNESDNTLIVEYELTSSSDVGFMKIEVDTYSTLWDIDTGIIGANALLQSSGNSSFYNGGIGVFGFNTTDSIIIDLDLGEMISVANITALSNHSQGLVFNSNTMEGVKNANITGIGRINYFRQGQESTTLATVVSYLCNKSGIESADLNVTELTDTIAGFTISRVSDAKTWLDLLARAYFFEGSESDYVLKFPKKAKASVLTIPSIDLLTFGKSDFSVNTIQEPELPKILELGYIDRLTSYEPGNARSQRIVSPTPTMFSNNKVTLGLPVILEPIEAKSMSEILLYNTWVERDNYQWSLSHKYLKLDPTDVIVVKTDLGDFTTRLVKLELDNSFVIKAAGISHEEALYHSAISSSGGIFVPQTIPGPNLTILHMVNIPLLVPEHDTFGDGMRMYFTMSGKGQDNWEGALLYRSSSSADFSSNDIGQSVREATVGITTTPLADFAFPNSTDKENSINFSLITGDSSSFVSRPLIDMYNDTTTWLLIGEELIQFATVVIESNGSITLSNLIRGRKNTEETMGNHTIGEKVILLDASTIDAVTEAVSNLETVFYYKGVGFGELLSTTETISQVSGGEAEKPYSIVQLKETPSGGDSIITWERRSRLDNSAFLDGTGVNLLGESTEQYEMDIEDVLNPGVVISTIVIDDARTHTITAADKISLGVADITVVVYQISELVGRGRQLEQIEFTL